MRYQADDGANNEDIPQVKIFSWHPNEFGNYSKRIIADGGANNEDIPQVKMFK